MQREERWKAQEAGYKVKTVSQGRVMGHRQAVAVRPLHHPPAEKSDALITGVWNDGWSSRRTA